MKTYNIQIGDKVLATCFNELQANTNVTILNQLLTTSDIKVIESYIEERAFDLKNERA